MDAVALMAYSTLLMAADKAEDKQSMTDVIVDIHLDVALPRLVMVLPPSLLAAAPTAASWFWRRLGA